MFQQQTLKAEFSTKASIKNVLHIEYAEDIRHTLKYKVLYEKRKETIERVVADAKEKYGMRYTLHRGLSHVTN